MQIYKSLSNDEELKKLSNYEALAKGEGFKDSDFSLLLGNAFVHDSCEEVWLGVK